MAKTKGPLLSAQAKGKIGDRLVFSFRRSGQQTRFQKKNKNVKTGYQLLQRALYENGVLAWLCLSDYAKLDYKITAQDENYTGYNLFMRNYLNNYILDRTKSVYGIAIYGITTYGEI